MSNFLLKQTQAYSFELYGDKKMHWKKIWTVARGGFVWRKGKHATNHFLSAWSYNARNKHGSIGEIWLVAT